MAEAINDTTDALHLKIEGLNTKIEALNIKIEALELKNLNYEYLLETFRSLGDTSHLRRTNDRRTFRTSGADVAKLQQPLEEWLHKQLDEGNNFNRATFRALTGVLLCLFENETANVSLIHEYIGGSRVTIVRHTGFLKKMGLIVYEGSRKRGYYVLTEKGKELREKLRDKVAMEAGS